MKVLKIIDRYRVIDDVLLRTNLGHDVDKYINVTNSIINLKFDKPDTHSNTGLPYGLYYEDYKLKDDVDIKILTSVKTGIEYVISKSEDYRSYWCSNHILSNEEVIKVVLNSKFDEERIKHLGQILFIIENNEFENVDSFDYNKSVSVNTI